MTMEEVKYPIAEIFTSWQGEGLWSGTRMTFIRLAGCNVGKPIPTSNDLFKFEGKEKVTEKYGIIPIWQEECTSWDGRKFLCDTDFRVKERLTASEIIDRVPEEISHICITGGEPLIHPVEHLFDVWYERERKKDSDNLIHIETSGTKIPRFMHSQTGIWYTISPKINCTKEMIYLANEIKLLVDENFNEKSAEELVKDRKWNTIVWLSAINGVDTLDKSNMNKCKEIAERHPTWRITQQAHKTWEVR